jgi:sugar O-acyltransferase (sialic acid O-acetyltransferase NeuD family)
MYANAYGTDLSNAKRFEDRILSISISPKNMKPIVLIGGGGHCRSVIDIIEQQFTYRIEGIVDLQEKRHEKNLGYEIFANDDDLNELVKQYSFFMITIGQLGINARRTELFVKLKGMGAVFPVIISPHAYVSNHALVAEGAVVMHGAVINAGARVGSNAIINTKALVEHDAEIGNHSHISTGAIVNGACRVGAGCFVGSGAVFLQGKSIANRVILGANSTVIENIEEAGTYAGTPARKLEMRVKP